MYQCSWGASIDDEEGGSAEDAFVKCVTLCLCELGELHDIGCLGSKAAVEHCFCLTLRAITIVSGLLTYKLEHNPRNAKNQKPPNYFIR